MESEPILSLEKVRVAYQGGHQALKSLTLKAGRGLITSLLGSNGAGKTTVFRTVSGLLEEAGGMIIEGSVDFEGESIQNLPPEAIVRRGIIHVLEGRQAFSRLSVEENLRVGAACGRSKSFRKDLERVYAYFPTLLARRKTLAYHCSNGELQMLVIGRALMADPVLMLLDEPSRGLAPLVEKENFATMSRINQQLDVTILLGEQKTSMALQISHYGYLMEGGVIIHENDVENLRKQTDLRNFYEGTAAGEPSSSQERGGGRVHRGRSSPEGLSFF